MDERLGASAGRLDPGAELHEIADPRMRPAARRRTRARQGLDPDLGDTYNVASYMDHARTVRDTLDDERKLNDSLEAKMRAMMNRSSAAAAPYWKRWCNDFDEQGLRAAIAGIPKPKEGNGDKVEAKQDAVRAMVTPDVPYWRNGTGCRWPRAFTPQGADDLLGYDTRTDVRPDSNLRRTAGQRCAHHGRRARARATPPRPARGGQRRHRPGRCRPADLFDKHNPDAENGIKVSGSRRSAAPRRLVSNPRRVRVRLRHDHVVTPFYVSMLPLIRCGTRDVVDEQFHTFMKGYPMYHRLPTCSASGRPGAVGEEVVLSRTKGTRARRCSTKPDFLWRRCARWSRCARW